MKKLLVAIILGSSLLLSGCIPEEAVGTAIGAYCLKDSEQRAAYRALLAQHLGGHELTITCAHENK